MKGLAGLAAVLVAIAYPIAVYMGLTRFALSQLTGAVVGVALLLLALRWFSRNRPQSLAVLLLPPVLVALLALVGWWVDEARLLLAMPSVINLALLVAFGHSLWLPPPLVERFARLTEAQLSAAQIRYCRQVTKVWCGFFVLNATLAGALAWMAPLQWWAVYTGLIAYLLMGLLMSAEYIIRKRRFQKFGTGLHDRFLSRLLATRVRGG